MAFGGGCLPYHGSQLHLVLLVSRRTRGTIHERHKIHFAVLANHRMEDESFFDTHQLDRISAS